jgi:hypothetical protein
MGDDNATQIEIYVQRKWLPRLAPVLERVVAWLEKRSPTTTQAPPALRPAPRKLLAFDITVRRNTDEWFGFLVISCLVMPLCWIVGGAELQDLPVFGMMVLFSLAGSTRSLIVAVARARALGRLFARCVLVEAHVTRRTLVWGNAKERHPSVMALTLEHSHGGVLHTAEVRVPERAAELLGPTMAVLIDPEDPKTCFVRDLYV